MTQQGRQWPAVYDTFRRFSIVARNLLEAHLSGGKPVPLESKTVPVRVDDTTWSYPTEQVPRLTVLVMQLEKELKTLPEYRACEDVMRGTSEIAQHLDTLVGTPSGAFRVTVDGVLRSILSDQLRVPQSPDEAFEAVYNDFVGFIHASQFEFEAWVPLENFHSTLDKTDLGVADRIEIRRIPDEKLQEWYSALEFSEWSPQRALRWTHGIRIVYGLPKVLGEHQTKPDAALAPERLALMEPSEQVLSALRLLKAGLVQDGPTFIVPRTWQPHGGVQMRWSLRGGHWLGTRYDFVQSDEERLRSLLALLRGFNPAKFRFVDVALRRLNQGYTRIDPDDRLIDLMIAFEALFLSDTGKGGYRGEMRFRLALRTALLLRREGARKQLFKEMLDAYDIRSGIVHGDRYDPPKVDGKEMPLNEFVSRIEEYLREAIREFLTLAQHPEAPAKLVDWTDVLFPTSPIGEQS